MLASRVKNVIIGFDGYKARQIRRSCGGKQTMSERQPQREENLSRRNLLKIIVGSAGAAVRLPAFNGAIPQSGAPVCHVAPQASRLAARTPKFFNPQQVLTLEAVSETIIPADEHSPGPKAARVWEYIDEIIADSDQKTKTLWTEGLAALDKMAELDHSRKFGECTSEQQTALLEKISKDEEHPTRLEEQFFVAMKKATVAGYYTSAIGIREELEYQGNVAQAEFVGCRHEEHKADEK